MMAKISCTSRFITITSKENLKIFSIENGNCLFTYTHEYEKATDGNNKPLDERLEDACSSQNGNYVCAIYSDKRLVVVSTKSWSVVREIKVKRRPTAMTFDTAGKFLFVADKSGDLYQYDIDLEIAGTGKTTESDKNGEIEDQPVLGHVSMVLDVKVSSDGRYILTADRDEKIRVSETEHPSVIESFCLGHTEFVCKVQPVPLKDNFLFLSSSGDGTIRLWDAKTGKQHGVCNFAENLGMNSNGNSSNRGTEDRLVPAILACDSSGAFAVVGSDQSSSNKVLILNINKDGPFLSRCSDFKILECERITDIKFGADGNILYVLVVSSEQKLTLLAYDCCDGVCEPVSDRSVLNGVNSYLIDLSCDVAEWESLFKIRCEGEVYSSYQKKKEERLAAKSKRRRPNETIAKRPKLK